MIKNCPILLIVCGYLVLIFVADCVVGRGIIRQKAERKNAMRKSDKTDVIQYDRQDGVNTSGNIKGLRCTDKDCKTSDVTEGQRHRHRHGRRKNNHKRRRGNRRSRRKNRNRKLGKSREMSPSTDPEDLMQVEDIPADYPSYDRYGTLYGRRRVDRLRRPPEADRLERRLHPSLAASSRDLIGSMDRVVMSMKNKIQQLHDTYDFAFNSTRYTVMMGIRQELREISQANDMMYDAVLDVSLLTKDIYMRAHRRGLTRPTTIRALEMPKFKSFSEDLNSVQREKRSAVSERNEGRRMVDSCRKQKEHLLQLKALLDVSKNERELFDLVRYVNQTTRKLQSEFDIAMVARKVGRSMSMSGAGVLGEVKQAQQLMYDAKASVRQTRITTRGNAIALEDWIRQRSGKTELAPVSITDIRHRPVRHRYARAATTTTTSGYLTAAETAIIRPIIDRAVHHANGLRHAVNRMERLLRPLLEAAARVQVGGGGRSFRAQASFLAARLEQDMQRIHHVLDRIRIAIQDEDELRLRCEELEMGSGDDGDTTPIDCDDYVEGSGNDTAATTPGENGDNDFEFIGETVPARPVESMLKRFGHKLELHIVTLQEKGEKISINAQTVSNKTKEFSRRWALPS